MNHDHPGNRRANTGAWARPASHKAPPGGTYPGAKGEAMRTAIVAIAVTLLAVLYRLRAEQAAHTQTRADLTACKSASRAACAVAQAVDGKADAGQLLNDLIKERKK